MTKLACLMLAAACLARAVVRADDVVPASPPVPPAPPAATLPASPISPEIAARIAAELAQFSSDQWKTRETAQSAVVRYGVDAIPQLEQLTASTSNEEARARAAASIRAIRENELSGPTFVSLHLKHAAPAAVLAEVAKQSRAQVVIQQIADTPVDVDFDHELFWDAMKKLSAQLNVAPQPMGDDRRMMISQGTAPWAEGPSVVHGPFLITANSIERSSSINLAAQQNVRHEFVLSLTALSEPKLHVLSSSFEAHLDEAIDDKGNSLVPAAGAPALFNDGMLSGGSQWCWRLSAHLEYPQGAGKRIALLRGSATFVVQTKSDVMEVNDVLKARNVNRMVAGRRVVLQDVVPEGDQYVMHVTVYRDNLNAEGWNELMNQLYGMRLLDAAGNPLALRGQNSSGSERQMDCAYTFARDNTWGDPQAKPGEPSRFFWEVPTGSKEVNVPFEFKDLPLP